MNYPEIQQKIDEAEPIWNCKANQWHETGCPHKDWTKEELQEAPQEEETKVVTKKRKKKNEK